MALETLEKKSKAGQRRKRVFQSFDIKEDILISVFETRSIKRRAKKIPA